MKITGADIRAVMLCSVIIPCCIIMSPIAIIKERKRQELMKGNGPVFGGQEKEEV